MNKKLTKLFARGKYNQILEWEIEVQGNRYRTITGSQGCQHVTSEWTECEGKNIGKKNETTPEEQARSEADSKWEKKKKLGYWENISDIDNTTFVEPMLAQHFKDHRRKLIYPVMVDRKYNGMRQVTTKHGAFTRKGEIIHTAPHIVEALKSLFEEYPDLVLDGELYNHDYRFKLNNLIRLVRKSKHFTPQILEESKKIVKYYVYDGYGFDFKNTGGGVVTEETGCFQRRIALEELLKHIPYIEVVPHQVAHDEQEVYSIYQEYVDDGYEGAIIRSWNSPYQHSRTDDLLKVKPEDDDEAVIQEIMEGTGNWAGAAKTATIKWKGITFDATFKGKYENLQEVLNNPSDWIGKTVTFLYIGLTGKGVPNSARIDVNNCNKGDR